MSFIANYFTSSESSSTPRYPLFRSRYIRDFDQRYNTIEMTIVSQGVTLTFNIDIDKNTPENTVSYLRYFCDELKLLLGSFDLRHIEFNADSYCFFRSPFVVKRLEDRRIVMCNLEYIRCQERFEIDLSPEFIKSMIRDFENILVILEKK